LIVWWTLYHWQVDISTETYPFDFDENAVAGLTRHRTPWSWLIYIVGRPLPEPRDSDSYFQKIRNEKSEKLKELFTDLSGEAREIVKEWRAINPGGGN